jgi:hypothetical protein
MIYIILACIYSGFLLYNVKIVSNEVIHWILFNNDTLTLNASNLIVNETYKKVEKNNKKITNDFFYSEFYFNELYYNYQNDVELFIPLIIDG